MRAARLVYTLSQEELAIVKGVAIKRQDAAEERNRPSAHGYDERDPLGVHLMGASAEYATSVKTGLPWHAFLEDLNAYGRKPPDVGDDIQVRSTGLPYGRLIVHNSDYPPERFVLAIVAGQRIELVGWTIASIAQHPRYWSDPTRKGRWAYFVPQRDLRPMAEMKELTF